jgi:hypothetical protein
MCDLVFLLELLVLTVVFGNGIVWCGQSFVLSTEYGVSICSNIFDMKFKKTGNNSRQLFLLTLAILFHTSANAQWYNPFAKKTAEDCVLEKIKETRGEDAVRALQMSCYSKYPSVNSSSTDDAALKAKNKRLERCGLKQDTYKTHIYFSNLFFYSPRNSVYLGNIKRPKYDRSRNVIEFQNNNDIGISGVMVGFTKAKQCSDNKDGYEIITYCKAQGYGTQSGVSPNSFGTASCGNVPRDATSLGYCVVGYSPFYDQFDDSLLEFSERNGYCINF